MSSPPRRVRLAVTYGDPRGIGPEVVGKALAQPIDAEIQYVGTRDTGTAFSETEAGRIAGEAIEAAARLALRGEVDAIVTGPVHKQALHAAGYRYPGVTE